MPKRKPPKYKHPGGVLGVPREVIRSKAYLDMSSNAQVLIIHLQDVWKDYEPVIHYSNRRVVDILGVSAGTASKAFKELEEHGFIQMAEECDWLNGKAREWRLTWLTANGREPTNEWKAWELSNPAFSQSNGQAPNRSASVTAAPKRPIPRTKNQQLRAVSGA